MQNFPAAVEIYEKLSKLFPEIQEYKVYCAQCLYKSGKYLDATKAALRIEDPQYLKYYILDSSKECLVYELT